MTAPSVRMFAAACATALAIFGCGKEPSAPGPAPKVAEEKVPPYSYKAPVSGHVKEVNIGAFDLVDGIAYTAIHGGGIVVYVASKPIASPVLVDSACPLTQALALSKLRNASFAEVTLDAAGRSRYFAAGTPFGGGGVNLTRADIASTLRVDAGRAVGHALDKEYGRFNFDLPVSTPKFDELSYADQTQERSLVATTPKPTEQAVTAAYTALRDAALRKNLKAMLSALGFDAKQREAIRGMDGIEADFMVFADRFLTPGTPQDPWVKPGKGQVRAEGVKSNGKKFTNDYYFDLCGDHLVLTYIVEQSP